MANKWDDISDKADEAAGEFFKNRISSLTRLTDEEVMNLITETGISNKDLAMVFKVVDDASKSNDAKAEAIMGISKGINALVGLASRII